ncbi:hypothetical protein OYA15_RS17980 [Escherichia coli]|nr:hypothetical protein [Escherichia coli O113]EKP9409119.1 hypothetical protein [Escherichia coli]EMA0570123.1 hypothetical protein [Escherichia coli]
MDNKTLTRVSQEAMDELQRIKKKTGLPHRVVMSLAVDTEVDSDFILDTPVSSSRRHLRIERGQLAKLKSVKSYSLDLARLLSLKIIKLGEGI